MMTRHWDGKIYSPLKVLGYSTLGLRTGSERNGSFIDGSSTRTALDTDGGLYT